MANKTPITDEALKTEIAKKFCSESFPESDWPYLDISTKEVFMERAKIAIDLAKPYYIEKGRQMELEEVNRLLKPLTVELQLDIVRLEEILEAFKGGKDV